MNATPRSGTKSGTVAGCLTVLQQRREEMCTASSIVGTVLFRCAGTFFERGGSQVCRARIVLRQVK
ncbi:MAG: hypothetical protein WC295_09915 [Methanoregula sp.]